MRGIFVSDYITHNKPADKEKLSSSLAENFSHVWRYLLILNMFISEAFVYCLLFTLFIEDFRKSNAAYYRGANAV